MQLIKKWQKKGTIIFGSNIQLLSVRGCTYLDEHAGLVVAVRRERLCLLGRDCCVTLDQRRHHAARRLDTQGQRRHVEQQQVLHLLRLQTQNRTQLSYG